MSFCYVILHYKTDIDTISCIKSIKEKDPETEIVIVDNFSNNGSIEKIEKIYSQEANVYIIKNQVNLGFASGNNMGYKFAKNELKSDFIAISNNDIVIDTVRMSERISDFYKMNRFDILGPDIKSLIDGGHQNPMKQRLNNRQETKFEIFRYIVLLALNRIGIYDLLKPNNKEKMRKSNNNHSSNIIQDVILHGSFLVFSPDYIKNEELAFREGTFLYMEESILYKYCIKKGYTTVFAPEIKVFHKEDSATNSLFKATKEKRDFVFKNMIKSLKVYMNIIE